MKKSIFILSALVIICTSCKQNQDKIGNLKTFAKAYGYVKYFHPSDEASAIDWNNFAAYGAEEIIKCKNNAELVETLNKLFKPIAPTAVFSQVKQVFDSNTITPENTDAYQIIYWQHKGVSKDMNYQNRVYQSVRVNRDSEIDESDSFGSLSIAINAEDYIGKEIKYTAWGKLKKSSKDVGRLWLRIDNEDNTVGFFGNLGANPITSNEWKKYEITAKVEDMASSIRIGCMLDGKGLLYIDDVHLYYKEKDEWIEIPIKNNDFEAETIGIKNEESPWVGKSKGYTYTVTESNSKKGKQCLAIAYEGVFKKLKGEAIFEASPSIGEYIEKTIGNGIYCQIPLSLYANEENTYPKGELTQEFLDNLNSVDEKPKNLNSRIGNVIIAYNVFQHFYPYFEEVDISWEKELETALKRSLKDKTDNDHLITLQKFTAPLKDGHIRVWARNEEPKYMPPIKWEMIEDKLVVTEILEDSLSLNIGDVVTRVNKQPTEDYLNEFRSRVSAGTKGWLNYRVNDMSIFGKKDSKMTFEVNSETISLKRTLKYNYERTLIPVQKNNYKLLDHNIYYLNLNTVPMDTIRKLMPKLKSSKGIICDLRGYPNSNHDLISHLLKEDDTTKVWMKTPKLIYPDQENIIGYEDNNWELKAKQPFLGDKIIVFIIDGSAISYAESYMGYIKGYKLATIVGQPTAGANGNINPFQLLGDYGISWTGMKVVKHDGSQHHAIGVLPDVYINKTINGVKMGKDEFLEKAVEVILKK